MQKASLLVFLPSRSHFYAKSAEMEVVFNGCWVFLRCKMRHLQTILAGSTVCFGHNHRQPRTEIFNSRRRSNEGIKRGAIWDFMTGKSPWGNPQIPILLLNGQGEKTPFVESLPPCFSTEPDCPPGSGVHVVCILPRIERIERS